MTTQEEEKSEGQGVTKTPASGRSAATGTGAKRTRRTSRPKAEEATPAEDAATGAAAKPTRRTSRPKAEEATPAADAATGAAAKPTRRTRRPKAEEATPAADAATGAAAKPTRRTRRPKAEEAAPAAVQTKPLPRLLQRLRAEVGPALMDEFGYTSPMQIPRVSKIVLNIGLGEALQNPRAMENASRDLGLISGQRPVTTRARKSIAGFKIRDGMAIGLSVTLRGGRMYEFLDRLISSSLPRIRDFRGVSRDSFDGRGNYSLGIREQVIFPEIDYNSIDRIRSLQVVIVTTARTDREGLRLLESLGMPFARTSEAARVA